MTTRTLPTIPETPAYHEGSEHGTGHNRYRVVGVTERRVFVHPLGRGTNLAPRPITIPCWERWLRALETP